MRSVRHLASPAARRVLVTTALLLLGSGIAAPGLARPAEAGATLRVGTSGDYPPFSRSSAGFDIAVARAFAADTGLDIVWVPFTWPTLAEQIARRDFDVAMGGITWRAERAALAPMTRAVAQGAPCVVGEQTPRSVAVNRGGILERFTRDRFADREIVTTDDNLELPGLLASGAVEAFVTDSFEVAHFARGVAYTCQPARDRKAYWVAPGRDDLLVRLDTWLGANEQRLAELRREYFGDATARSPQQHLADLLARRFDFMPHVARYKAAHDIAITDQAQEERILAGAEGAAAERGLSTVTVRALFETLIDLAKAVQERTPAGAPTLDLTTEIRPALARLTPRLLDALVELDAQPQARDMTPLTACSRTERSSGCSYACAL